MHSKFQKEILLFYRQVFRWANKKPEPARTSIKTYVRDEYKKNQNIPKKKFDRVCKFTKIRLNFYLDRVKINMKFGR